MKFDLNETVTGAELRPGVAILTFSRDRLAEVLNELGKQNRTVDAFVVDRQRVTAAVLLSEEETEVGDALLSLGVTAESGYFRLILRGRRLTEGRGLAGLWESVLAEEKIPLRLSCADGTGIIQYLHADTRPAVLALLDRTFGIKVV